MYKRVMKDDSVYRSLKVKYEDHEYCISLYVIVNMIYNETYDGTLKIYKILIKYLLAFTKLIITN